MENIDIKEKLRKEYEEYRLPYGEIGKQFFI